MTTKPLILLGVVTALGLAGAPAEAQVRCPVFNQFVTVASVLGTPGGYSCLDDDSDMMYSNFSFGPQTSREDRVSFPANDTISIQGFPRNLGNNNESLMTYTVTALPGVNDLAGVKLTTLSQGSSGVLTTRYVGTGLDNFNEAVEVRNEPNPGSVSNNLDFKPIHSITATLSLRGTGNEGSAVAATQVLNAYTHTEPDPEQPGVPEPMSLSLFGLGLGGLALVRRRRA